MKSNFIDELIEYRNNDFDEAHEFVTLKNGKTAIMFYPRSVDDSIIITIFIGKEYCRLLAGYNDRNKHVNLGDIQVLQNDLMGIGIGTILLEKLIEIAKKEKALKITGWMSYESEKQKQRQMAFYNKNGFMIDEKENLLYEISFE